MGFKKKMAAGLTGLAVFSAVLFGVAAPAQATLYWNCSNGVACIWTDANGGGDRLVIAVGIQGTNRCWNLGNTFNDKVSSASADFGSGWQLRLYRDSDCSNTIWTADIYLTHVNFNTWANDAFSSFQIIQH